MALTICVAALLTHASKCLVLHLSGEVSSNALPQRLSRNLAGLPDKGCGGGFDTGIHHWTTST